MLRDSMYRKPALAAATADGVGLLGLALYYDTSVNHGPGVAGSGDGSFDDIRSRATGPTPATAAQVDLAQRLADLSGSGAHRMGGQPA